MPKRLLRFLDGTSPAIHLGIALLLGLALRSLAAYYVYGPLAVDDTVHGLSPAAAMAAGKWPAIPAYRSYLLVWLLARFYSWAAAWGMGHGPAAPVRFVYGCLGVLSLGTIAGAYFYARAFRELGNTFAALAMYLMAAHFLMPFAGTRAFGECVAMPFLTLGLGLAELGRKEDNLAELALGLALLGVATLLRFQVVIVFAGYAAFLAVSRQHRGLAVAVGVAIAMVLAEGLIDSRSGRPWLSTFGAYLKENGAGAAEYGVQPWYAHLAFLAACTLPPFSLVFLDRLPALARDHAPTVLVLVAFVGAHSVIAHKEERFMFPMLPLVLLLLAAAWADKADTPVAKLVYFPAFAVLNSLAVIVVSISNTQAGDIQPLVELQERYGTGVILETSPSINQNFLATGLFLKKPVAFERVAPESLTPTFPRDYFARHPGPAIPALVVTTPDPALAIRLETMECGPVESATSLLDRIIYRVNPKRNTRRRPIFYVVCARGR